MSDPAAGLISAIDVRGGSDSGDSHQCILPPCSRARNVSSCLLEQNQMPKGGASQQQSKTVGQITAMTSRCWVHTKFVVARCIPGQSLWSLHGEQRSSEIGWCQSFTFPLPNGRLARMVQCLSRPGFVPSEVSRYLSGQNSSGRSKSSDKSHQDAYESVPWLGTHLDHALSPLIGAI